MCREPATAENRNDVDNTERNVEEDGLEFIEAKGLNDQGPKGTNAAGRDAAKC